MHHKELLTECLRILNQRAQSYGNEDNLFEVASQIASLISGRDYSKYDISVVMESIKLARRRFNPLLDDSYIDQINYTAFSAQFAKEAFIRATPIPEEEIAAPAMRPYPVTTETTNEQNVRVHFDGDNTSVVSLVPKPVES
jgi:hypothetical protein